MRRPGSVEQVHEATGFAGSETSDPGALSTQVERTREAGLLAIKSVRTALAS